MKHAWEDDERGDGMPILFCRRCGKSIMAGAAGMGAGMGPARGGFFGPKQDEYNEVCPKAPREKKIRTGPVEEWDEF